MSFDKTLGEIKAGRWLPVYLIYGSETFWRDRFLEAFREVVAGGPAGDFNFDLLDGRETSLDTVLTLANTLPFLAERRLIILRDAAYFKSRRTAGDNEEANPVASDEKKLLAYLELPNPQTTVVMVADEIDARKKTVKKIQENGGVIASAAPKGKALLQWISDRFKHYGVTVNSAGASCLSALVGDNLAQLDQEIDKIGCYLGPGGKAGEETIWMLVGKTAESSIFEMVDAIGNRRPETALEIMRELIKTNVPVPYLVAMVGRQWRLIRLARRQLDRGLNYDQALATIPAHPFVAGKCLRQAGKFNATQLEQALIKLLDLDVALKTGRGDQALLLETYILDVAG